MSLKTIEEYTEYTEEKGIDNAQNIPDVFTMDCIKEKKPDNPFFAEEKKKQHAYVDSLQQQVDYIRERFPEKYKKYQSIGDSLMSCTYNPTPGRDDEGDSIKAQTLLYSVRDYDLEDDLSSEELRLLIKVYGVDWKSKINDL